MVNFWKDKNIVITGASGFLGTHLCNQLGKLEANIFSMSSAQYDLRYQSQVESMFDSFIFVQPRPIVFNLAANVGGIGYNQNHPYRLFTDNAQITLNMIDAATRYNIEKFIQIGTVCAYPKFAKPPFREEMLWDGYPEETNAPYGLAKKLGLVQLQAARQELNFNGIYLLQSNLYGPGDNFANYRSHVIPALIKRSLAAKKNNEAKITVWGTGEATRDFLYIDDAVNGIISAAEKYNSSEPLNLGSGQEIRIAVLVYMINQLVDYRGDIEYDQTKPDGQPRRGLNVDKAKYILGWKAKIQLREGLRRTIEWYKKEVGI